MLQERKVSPDRRKAMRKKLDRLIESYFLLKGLNVIRKAEKINKKLYVSYLRGLHELVNPEIRDSNLLIEYSIHSEHLYAITIFENEGTYSYTQIRKLLIKNIILETIKEDYKI